MTLSLEDILAITLENNHIQRDYWDMHAQSQSSAMEKARVDFCYLAHRAGHPHKEIAKFIHKRESTVVETIRNIEEGDSAIREVLTCMSLARLICKEGQE